MELKEKTIAELEMMLAEINSEIELRKAPEAILNGRKLIVDGGFVDQGDLGFESHKRGTNWIAIVAHDPGQPGGLNRIFWEKGSGSYKKIPATLAIGNIIEVAYDYSSAGGNRTRNRDYYKVLQISEKQIVIEDTAKP